MGQIEVGTGMSESGGDIWKRPRELIFSEKSVDVGHGGRRQQVFQRMIDHEVFVYVMGVGCSAR